MDCVSTIACIEFPSEIPCSIDLIEPFEVVNGQRIETALKLESGETYDLKFLYKVGVPAADTFHLFFYRTPEDVQDVMRGTVAPMTHQITPDPPVEYSFLPIAPVADETGIAERQGMLNIAMSEMAVEAYYGILGMSHP